MLTYILREMLCGHSADIVRTYISRDICPHNVRTISFFGFQLNQHCKVAKNGVKLPKPKGNFSKTRQESIFACRCRCLFLIHIYFLYLVYFFVPFYKSIPVSKQLESFTFKEIKGLSYKILCVFPRQLQKLFSS